MKKFIVTFVFFLVAGIIVFSQQLFTAVNRNKSDSNNESHPLSRLTNTYSNAVWDWNFPESSEINNEFFTALSQRGVDSIYLNINSFIDIYEQSDIDKKTNDLLKFNNALRKYIVTAKNVGISVHAVAGGKNWGNSSHRYLNKIIIDFVFGFNRKNPDYNFAGLQFDIEPYSQEWFFVNQESILSQYLDSVDEITKYFSQLQVGQGDLDPIDLGFAVPYWFDGENENMKKILWKGEEKFVLYHLLNRLNTVQDGYIALMSYRNFSEGRDGVIEHSKTEINFLTEYLPRVDIVIAQETSDVYPGKITYYEKKFSYMNDQLENIASFFGNSKNLKGFAFNNAETFLNLK